MDNKRQGKLVPDGRKIPEYTTGDSNHYQVFFELYHDAVFLEAQDGRILDCNRAALNMYGYTKEEMLGLTVKDLLQEEISKVFPLTELLVYKMPSPLESFS